MVERRFPRSDSHPQFRGVALLFRARIRRVRRLLRVLYTPPVFFLPFPFPLHIPNRFLGTALRAGKNYIPAYGTLENMLLPAYHNE